MKCSYDWKIIAIMKYIRIICPSTRFKNQIIQIEEIRKLLDKVLLSESPIRMLSSGGWTLPMKLLRVCRKYENPLQESSYSSLRGTPSTKNCRLAIESQARIKNKKYLMSFTVAIKIFRRDPNFSFTLR